MRATYAEMNLVSLRIANIVLTGFGAAIFVALFLYINLAPDDFDMRVRAFAIEKVSDRVTGSLTDPKLISATSTVASVAEKISPNLKSRLDDHQRKLDEGVDRFVADVLSATCKLDCERREQARIAIRQYYETSIARFGGALERVEQRVAGQYDKVMEELRTDLRIFAGSNAIMLIFAFLLSVFKGKAAAHLVPISLLLTASTALMAVWYLFGQNWVMTLIFSDYWGWTYSIFLGVIAAFLIDIAINAARITSVVFNALLNVVGSAFHFAPC